MEDANAQRIDLDAQGIYLSIRRTRFGLKQNDPGVGVCDYVSTRQALSIGCCTSLKLVLLLYWV